DRAPRELLVDLARQAADPNGADTRAVGERRDPAAKEREERVEARPLRGVLAGLRGELGGAPSIAAGGGVRLPLRVQPRIRRGTVHRRRGDDLAVAVRHEDRDRAGGLGDDEVDDGAGLKELHTLILTD